MTDKPNLIDRIGQHYDALPESERAIADLIMEAPGDVVLFQSSEIATRAGVSNAAVTRLVRRLDYRDYREVQTSVRDAQIHGVPLYRITSASRQFEVEGWPAQHLEAEIACLTRTYETLDAGAFDKAVAATVSARRVWTLGTRVNSFHADFLRRQLSLFRSDVIALPSAGQSVVEDLASATKKDLVIIIGMRRRTKSMKTYLKMLQEIGVPTIYFCDHQTVTTAQLVTWCFRCNSSGIGQIDTYSALSSLLGTFVSRFIAKAGKPALAFNKQVEDWLDGAGDLEIGN